MFFNFDSVTHGVWTYYIDFKTLAHERGLLFPFLYKSQEFCVCVSSAACEPQPVLFAAEFVVFVFCPTSETSVTDHDFLLMVPIMTFLLCVGRMSCRCSMSSDPPGVSGN